MNFGNTYQELLAEKENAAFISYAEKLMTKEWLSKRNEIVKRDKYKCADCERKSNLKAWWISDGIVFIRDLNDFERNKMGVSFIYETEKVSLQVHHKYYINGHLPWEYKDEALVTLCSPCHKKLHASTKVYIYDDESLNKPIPLTPCPKCSGTGFLPHYYYYKNGICFSCNGNRFLEW